MELKNILNNAKTGVVIMAHPDDETCWAGGLILSNPHIKWSSICCSYPRNPADYERINDYLRMCNDMGITAYQIDQVATGPGNPLQVKNTLKLFNINDYDVIVTHGHDGDYGHIHHKNIFQQVKALANKEFIGTGYLSGKYYYDIGGVFGKKMNMLKYYKSNSYKDKNGNIVSKWKRLLEVYLILNNKTETFNIYKGDGCA